MYFCYKFYIIVRFYEFDFGLELGFNKLKKGFKNMKGIVFVGYEVSLSGF